ncbi:Protein MRPL-24 [Aphelenchoides avenae]|nr:Protein MRPL-24 [Aphelenchus avenae]
MFPTKALCLPQRFYADLEFARHFPKAYVDRMKRTVPKKVYSNRFGAPDIIRWTLPPEDSIPSTKRPWVHSEWEKSIKRERDYHASRIMNKYWEKRINTVKPIPPEQWNIFPGDIVEVMVGDDKGRQGNVSHVIREANAVFVDSLHTKLEDEYREAEKMGVAKTLRWKEQPLDVSKGEVKLVDPNDNLPCEAEWIVNEEGTDYIRVSLRTGYEIPLPSLAKRTYEYNSPEHYLEVEGKDTKADDVLKVTYSPKLCTFEQEIMEAQGIKEDREPKPTYWY